MLLCPRPYFNEPGTGVSRDTEASIAYDKEVTLQTARVAICDWMVPANKNGIWKVRPPLNRGKFLILGRD